MVPAAASRFDMVPCNGYPAAFLKVSRGSWFPFCRRLPRSIRFSDPHDGFDDVGFVGDAFVHGGLDVVEAENVGDDAFEVDFARGYGFDGHGVLDAEHLIYDTFKTLRSQTMIIIAIQINGSNRYKEKETA